MKKQCSMTRETLLDEHWLFHRGDSAGAQAAEFDDSSWRPVRLPHDWSIEDLPPLVPGDTEIIDAVEGEWRFHQGDNPAWAAPDLDDSSWQKVMLPDTWESHSNYTDDNVYGWYRRRIRIGSHVRGKKIAIGVGLIDDVDETFFNGVRIGGCGTFPPQYQSACSELRVYEIPVPLVRFDGDNVIAVRVFDGPGNGGIYSKTPIVTRRGPFDSTAPGGVSTGFTIGGIGWYRTSFEQAMPRNEERVLVRFDGVYMNALVWINGVLIANHPYGYSSFWCDLTPHVRDGRNVLAVQVNNTGVNARWYSGSGIYRHVWLCTFPAVHAEPWGVWVSTPRVSGIRAAVRVRTAVRNDSAVSKSVTVLTTVLDPDGKRIAGMRSRARIAAGARFDFGQQCAVRNPRRWNPDTPHRYSVRTIIRAPGCGPDCLETRFGIRSIAFDARNGFRLNGKSLKLKGACVHHDHGCLGACSFDRAEERRVEILKANGYNAVRTSHNPPSGAFLDACDRLGMLVMDESFDVWYYRKRENDYAQFFALNWPRDLDSMVLRDRNHPCVIMWSIGNEIHEQSERLGVDVARMLAAHVRELDDTRPVTAALCYGHLWHTFDPMFAQLDVAGYNYQLDKYDSDRARVPSRIMVATETFPSRAYDYWQAVLRLPCLIGDFVWTGWDYLGEAGIGWGENITYPWTVAYCGDIDLCGHKKPQSYFRDMLWKSAPAVHIVVACPEPSFAGAPTAGRWEWEDVISHWNWSGREGQPMEVRVYSNCRRVRLLLDGVGIGTARVSHCVAMFTVPYRPGRLTAVGLDSRKEVAVHELRTAGAPSSLRLTPDRAVIRADGYDLSFITVELFDRDGVPVAHDDCDINFSLAGPGELAGVSSGNPVSAESFQRPYRRTWRGKALAVVRSTRDPGRISLTATIGKGGKATAFIDSYSLPAQHDTRNLDKRTFQACTHR